MLDDNILRLPEIAASYEGQKLSAMNQQAFLCWLRNYMEDHDLQAMSIHGKPYCKRKKHDTRPVEVEFIINSQTLNPLPFMQQVVLLNFNSLGNYTYSAVFARGTEDIALCQLLKICGHRFVVCIMYGFDSLKLAVSVDSPTYQSVANDGHQDFSCDGLPNLSDYKYVQFAEPDALVSSPKVGEWHSSGIQKMMERTLWKTLCRAVKGEDEEAQKMLLQMFERCPSTS
jgi:hypothetical protein